MLDAGLVHIGEGASVILDGEFSKSEITSDEFTPDKKNKSQRGTLSPFNTNKSPVKHLSKKQKEAEEMRNAEYDCFLICRKQYRNNSSHSLKNEGLDLPQ